MKQPHFYYNDFIY